ncbi:cationic peroxidase 1-like [Prunus avium]|uniref:peroxidase n=1 Tax=Prunus avium TaxID=42229 RepID=A0A6P5TLH1_PRUAV|nr:cationic peroxidase 1-like [Prunus avium]
MIQLVFGITNTSNIYKFWHAAGIPNSQNVSGDKENQGPKLIVAFSKKGFTVKETVALSGAHTIGQARCAVFRGRLYNNTHINAPFAAAVRAKCPGNRGSGNNNLSQLDVTSPTTFDNAYFKNAVSQKGLLHSDQQLYSGEFTRTAVDAYANNAASFMEDFAEAMNKMGRLSPLTGSSGQIRTNCRKVN